MELNPDLHYLVHRERAADAMRDAERWRLIKLLQEQGGSPGWLERVGLRRLVRVRHDDEARIPGSGARQTASSPTP